MSGVTKDIVNIQNNKLKFYVNGTNRFDVDLKSTNFLSIRQDKLHTVEGRITASGVSDGTNVISFSGKIDDISNHNISDLSNVAATNATVNQIIKYNGTNWVASELPSGDITFGTTLSGTNVSPATNGTLFVGNNAVDISFTTSATTNTFDISLSTSYFNVSLTTNAASNDTLSITSDYLEVRGILEIGTNKIITSQSKNVKLYVDGNSEVGGNLTVTGNLTVQGTQTILNTEIKLIEDSLIELGYTDGTNASGTDIGYIGRYNKSGATNFAASFYDVSDYTFRFIDQHSDVSITNNIVAPTNYSLAKVNVGSLQLGDYTLGSSFSASSNQNQINTVTYSTTFNTTVKNYNSETLLNYSTNSSDKQIFVGKMLISVYDNSSNFNNYGNSLSDFNIIKNGTNITKNFMTNFEQSNGLASFSIDSNGQVTVQNTNTGVTNYLEVRTIPLFSALR